MESMDELDEDPDLFAESDELDEDEADDSFDEDALEEFDDEMEEVLESTEDADEELESLDEALEDIGIDNKFEGSGINDDDYNANDDLFTGWKDNTDEKGLSRYEDQNTLPFDHVTSGSFNGMKKDPSIDDMLN